MHCTAMQTFVFSILQPQSTPQDKTPATNFAYRLDLLRANRLPCVTLFWMRALFFVSFHWIWDRGVCIFFKIGHSKTFQKQKNHMYVFFYTSNGWYACVICLWIFTDSSFCFEPLISNLFHSQSCQSAFPTTLTENWLKVKFDLLNLV